jgi:peptide deformylase
LKLHLRYYGDPILRKKTETVTEITDEVKKLAAAMIEALSEFNGIGLTTTQVGYLYRFFVLRRYIHLPDGKWTIGEPLVYINPKILSYSKETWVEEEACLSIPKLYLPVERPLKIAVESTRLDGTQEVEEIEGLNARVILHENDHLNGVLFIDRVEDKYLKPVEKRLKEIKERYQTR